MKKTFLLILTVCLFFHSFGQENRNLLSGRYDQQKISKTLIPFSGWHPYPVYGDTNAWKKVNQQTREAYIHKAETLLHTKWDELPASVFLEYKRNGNRTNFENLSFSRRNMLTSLVLGELLEGKGRFIEDIVNGIWAICEESWWGIPAHNGSEALPDINHPIVDLFAAQTSALLAWTNYFLKDSLDKVSPLISQRINMEIKRRILTPCLERDDFWWMGFGKNKIVNNWNPWINSNWLTSVLLTEQDEERRQKAVYKIMQSLDIFINGYHDDGGCDEGPGYWNEAGGRLLDCLSLLKSSTNGTVDIFNDHLIKEMGNYICKVFINNNYYVNFADASAINHPEAGLVYRFGKETHDSTMLRFAAFLARQEKFGESILEGTIDRQLAALNLSNEILAIKSAEPLIRDSWLSGLQVMTARSSANTTKGLYLAAKGGNNNESHNHNDVGNFIIFADGKPLLIDVGVETYTAKTFGPNRYDIWTMQSAYHNLPTINGYMQIQGRKFEASDVRYAQSDKKVVFSLNIAKAYPAEAKVLYWNRTLSLYRGQKIEIKEDYQLSACNSPLKLNLMTPCDANIEEPGKVILKSNDNNTHIINYDPGKYTAQKETIEINDNRLRPVWGDKLYRIILLSKNLTTRDQTTLTIK